MRLAISNIAWSKEEDPAAYTLMRQYGFTGLEIAPTRIIEPSPYAACEKARQWAADLRSAYHFDIPSMQSILFGKTERIFGTENERAALLAYLQQAVDFAGAVSCGHLVFGAPRNRAFEPTSDLALAVPFFRQAARVASQKGIVIGMEANPPIYNTNYINTTSQAAALVREVADAGFRVNLDFGTILENNESIRSLEPYVDLFSHVHISEPHLMPVQPRPQHQAFLAFLAQAGYSGYISIEMKREPTDPLGAIERAMAHIANIAASA